MSEDVIRAAFSWLAATVTLGMSQEWATWAIEQQRWWKLIPAFALAAAAVFEAHQIWRRGERIFGLTHE